MEVTKLVVSLFTPLAVVFIGYLLNKRLKAMERSNEIQNRQYAEEQELRRREYEEEKELRRQQQETEKEEHRQEKERRYYPHIELTLQCQMYGPQDGHYLADFRLCADNKGIIRQEFKKVMLRVRGIERNKTLDLWEQHEPRLNVPEKLFETNIVPPNVAQMFVEPGVKQEFNFLTRIDEQYRFIVVRAEFRYSEMTFHSVERVFEVDNNRASN